MQSTSKIIGTLPLPILDTSGKVREWLTRDGCFRVWVSLEIGVERPHIFTPSNGTCPHWAYKDNSQLLSEVDCVFYQKSGVAYYDGKFYEWPDTTQGYKKAEKVIGTLPANNGDSPVPFAYEYTIERMEMRSVETRADGRPLQTHFMIAIIQWTARLT